MAEVILNYTSAQINEAVGQRHTHDNKSSIDRISGDAAPLWNGTTWPGGGGGISEAPIDGKQYARQNAAWSEIIGGASTDLPWCSGHFQNRSLTGGSSATLTPIVDSGDILMVSGNDFLINEDGIYAYSAAATGASASAAWIVNVSVTDESLGSVSLGRIYQTAQTVPPFVAFIKLLKTGDRISHVVNSSVGQSTLGTIYNFTIACIKREEL